MKARPWGMAGIAIVAVFVAGMAVGYLLAIANGTADASQIGLPFAFGAYAVVGALIVSRQPGNAIGWLFAGVGLLIATGFAAAEYGFRALVEAPGSLPGGVWAAWYGGWVWFLVLFFAVVMPPLLFPTGRVVTPRWRPFLWLAILLVAGMVVTTMVQETIEVSGAQEVGEGSVVIDNPIGISGVPDAESGALGVATLLLFGVVIVGGIASMVVRFRRSRRTERQQLKWFTYAVALLFLLPLGDFAPVGEGLLWDGIVFPAVIAFIPVAAGIAILRYRLYDIDVVINRTLVYGLLTAILAAGYLGLVALTQVVLQPLTPRSDLAIVVSTLAVAALFRPLRSRVQGFIDRRFYRHKYDATATLDRFAARLRDQLDLESLRGELVAVVGTTMQPAHTSLWLRSVEEAEVGEAGG